MRFYVLVSTLILLFMCEVQAVLADDQEEYRVIFSTFTNDSAGEYSYLRDSVQAMVISRLAAKDRITIIDSSLGEEELQKLQTSDGDSVVSPSMAGVAEYLISGGLFQLTTGLNVQIVLYPLQSDKEVLRFSIVSESTDSLIKDVEKLVQEISGEAFGYKIEEIVAQGATGDKGERGFVTAHPEAAYKKRLYTGTIIGIDGAGFKTKARGVKRSTSINQDLMAFSAGDLNGDGEEELVTLAGRHLSIYKIQERDINLVAKTTISPKLQSHALNTGDLDGDQKEEIYISATDGLYVSSLVMKWDGAKQFTTVAANIPFYIRPVNLPERGLKLVGQRRGGDKIDLVAPGIHLLNPDGAGKYKLGQTLPIPKSVNLFDFSYADLDGDKTPELLAIDQNEKLKVFNSNNQLVWVSTRNFGGSIRYFGPSQGEAANERDTRNFTTDEDSERELIFIPARMIIQDIDKDGKDEVIVNENKMVALSYFKRLRIYNSGTVVGLGWDGEGLREAWRTGNYRGYLTDYSFSMFAESQEKASLESDVPPRTGRICIANIPSKGSFMALLPGSEKTKLTIYDLEFIKQKQSDNTEK